MQPTRKEIAFFYKTHRRQFEAPERIHALQIFKNVDELCALSTAWAVMRQAEAELQVQRPFREVAERYSDCRGDGGDLGWFARDVMVEEFEKIVFSCSARERTGIFETRFGLHIVQVLEHAPAGIRPLREVYGLIAEHLVKQHLAKGVEK